jgi:hypothetical protein
MANHVLLNNVDHKDLRIITRRSTECGDNVRFGLTFSWEFRNVQACYPIVFSKNPETGSFTALAMFGFEEGENLFLDENGWNASYIPMTIETQPFLIGLQQPAGPGASDVEPVVHIDMDSPRISDSEGEPVFLPHGGISEYLERINSKLHTIHNGFAGDQEFLGALTEHDLLESFVLDVQLNDGSQNRLSGFYTINEDRLRGLDGAALSSLNERGFLLPVYMAIASLVNLRTLIDRRNALLET